MISHLSLIICGTVLSALVSTEVIGPSRRVEVDINNGAKTRTVVIPLDGQARSVSFRSPIDVRQATITADPYTTCFFFSTDMAKILADEPYTPFMSLPFSVGGQFRAPFDGAERLYCYDSRRDRDRDNIATLFLVENVGFERIVRVPVPEDGTGPGSVSFVDASRGYLSIFRVGILYPPYRDRSCKLIGNGNLVNDGITPSGTRFLFDSEAADSDGEGEDEIEIIYGRPVAPFPAFRASRIECSRS